MENIEKENKRLKVLLVIMIVVLLGLGCYHYYVTYINVDKCVEDNAVVDNNVVTDSSIIYDYENISGYYKGSVIDTPEMDDKGITYFSLYLYENGTFSLNESRFGQTGFIGNYIIKDNKLNLNYLYSTNSGAGKKKTSGTTIITIISNDKLSTIAKGQGSSTKEQELILTKENNEINENQFDHYFNYDEE